MIFSFMMSTIPKNKPANYILCDHEFERQKSNISLLIARQKKKMSTRKLFQNRIMLKSENFPSAKTYAPLLSTMQDYLSNADIY